MHGLISWALDRGFELGGDMPTSSSSSSSSNLRRPAAPAWVVSSGELEASEPSSSSANRRHCQSHAEQSGQPTSSPPKACLLSTSKGRVS